MAVLDGSSTSAACPAPNVGIARKQIEEIEAILGRSIPSETEENSARPSTAYKKGTIDGDELTHELAAVLEADDAAVVHIMDEVFPESGRWPPSRRATPSGAT